MKRVTLFWLVILSLAIPAAADAAGTWNDLTGPTWTGTGYQWTVNILSYDQGQMICVTYETPGEITKKSPTVKCEPGEKNYIGPWTCTLASQPNATPLNWRLGYWTAGGGGNTNCGDEKEMIASGSFKTSTTAVTLTSLQASSSPSISAGIAVAGLVWLLGTADVLRRAGVR